MKEASHNPLSESILKKGVRLAVKTVIPLSATTSLILASCGGEKNNTPEIKNNEPSGYSLPFPKGETWYLTTGPHGDGYSNGIKYAIDIAPAEFGRLNGSCPTDGSRLSIDNRIVTASASGEVTVKGDDKNRNDSHHSEIRIKDKNGLTEVYIHLDNTKVKLGDEVKQGDPLGNPSCEYPPQGRNTGPHVHVGLMKDDQAIPIDGAVVGGWTIHEGVNGQEGTMTKDGEKTRTADTGRYGENSTGIRNDLTNSDPNKSVVAVPKDPIRPISATITSKEVSVATSTPAKIQPTETPKPNSTPEKNLHIEGVLAVKGWRFEIQDWKESDYQPFRNYMGQQDKIRREGWKYVTVEGRARNMGTNILSLNREYTSDEFLGEEYPVVDEIRISGQSYYTNRRIGFSFISQNNNVYKMDNITYRTSPVPPGFSDDFFVSGWIPEIQNDYGLSAVVLDRNNPNAPIKPGTIEKIKKGEVSKNQPDIFPNVLLNEINRPWTIPNFGEITYNNKTVMVQGDRLEDYDWTTGKYRIYQYISLNLQNNTGQDISPTSLSFVIFSKGGDIIEGERATREGLNPPIVAPGLKKTFYIYAPFEDTKKIEEEIKGGILVGINKDNWFAWQLP